MTTDGLQIRKVTGPDMSADDGIGTVVSVTQRLKDLRKPYDDVPPVTAVGAPEKASKTRRRANRAAKESPEVPGVLVTFRLPNNIKFSCTYSAAYVSETCVALHGTDPAPFEPPDNADSPYDIELRGTTFSVYYVGLSYNTRAGEKVQIYIRKE